MPTKIALRHGGARPAADDSLDRTLDQSPRQQAWAQRWSAGLDHFQVPGYVLQHRLGQGSFGEVWLAFEKNTGREVAIKFFARHQGLDWPLLKREVGKLVQVIAERRVVQLLAVGWEAEPPYFVMEYLEGGSLADRLHHGTVPVKEAVGLFREIAEALVHLHGKAILHCDLKPANVLLDSQGRVRLADFGQARRAGEAGPAVGTLFYTAPEQARPEARPDVRADIYALGAVLYTLLTGGAPYETEEVSHDLASTDSVAKRITRYREHIEAAEPATGHHRVEGVDRALREIIDRCLARDPAARYENVQQVIDALDARRRQRANRPLVAFGLLGPLALLAVLATFGLWTVREAAAGARGALTAQTLDNHLGTARVVAAAVDDNLDAVQRRLEREAGRDDIRTLLARFHNAASTAERRTIRRTLAGIFEALYVAYEDRHFYSWLVADADGVVLTRAPFDERVVGTRYTYREWFTGRPERRPDAVPDLVAPRLQTGLTLAFQSTAAGHPILISVATPVRAAPPADGGEAPILGVMVGTLHLDTFNEWLSRAETAIGEGGCPERFAVLLDRGQVVRHPCPAPAAPRPPVPAEAYYRNEAVVTLLEAGTSDRFIDPLGDGRPFLAAAVPLQSNATWTTIVQQSRASAMAPIDALASRTWRLGRLVFTLGLALMAVLWLLLYRVTRQRTPFGA